jgi:hypothetical protein
MITTRPAIRCACRGSLQDAPGFREPAQHGGRRCISTWTDGSLAADIRAPEACPDCPRDLGLPAQPWSLCST